AARPRGRKADAEPPGVFGVTARHERRGLLVAHLDEADLLLPRAQRFHDAVDAVARDAEHGVDAPIQQGLDQHVGCGFCHGVALLKSAASRGGKERWQGKVPAHEPGTWSHEHLVRTAFWPQCSSRKWIRLMT